MNSLQSLQSAKNLTDLARLLKIEPKKLSFMLFELDESKKYKNFFIPKKNGGEREINAPTKGLKVVQKRLSRLLYQCLEELEEDNIKNHKSNYVKSVSHGFRSKVKLDKKTSIDFGIFSNAKMHKSNRYVLNFDLKDFFDSFNFGRVRGVFIKDKRFLLNEKVATCIAQIACFDNKLPQGSPCSPVITNLIANILDKRILIYLKKYGCYYSRYADDLTISYNQKIFPQEVAYKIDYEPRWELSCKLIDIIESSGFVLNNSKTRMQYSDSRQVVTGLVVNKKVNLCREYYKNARAMTHTLLRNGDFTIPAYPNDKLDIKINRLNGILNFIHDIRTQGELPKEKEIREFENRLRKKEKNSNKNKGISKKKKILSASELYSNFLYYKHFVANTKPIILCEGETDNIYFKCAEQSLSKELSKLGWPKVEYLKRGTLVNDVMRIAPGASGLVNLASFYRKETVYKKNTNLVRSNPVILVFDNDSAAQGITGILEKKGESPEIMNSELGFMSHVELNLYAVVIPKIKDTDTEIENFFSPEDLKRTHNNKRFLPDRYKDEEKNKQYFGKAHFAKHIVRRNKKEIDFKNFMPIFKLMLDAIKKHPQTLKKSSD